MFQCEIFALRDAALRRRLMGVHHPKLFRKRDGLERKRSKYSVMVYMLLTLRCIELRLYGYRSVHLCASLCKVK